ncbi:kynurenine formamidase [Macrobrachium rosenbergii]|uniref:kynurenine formamidase n=1 Tax=Macrobrachium rosenbergii TaxID=79674 RepID=UPI0034D5673A
MINCFKDDLNAPWRDMTVEVLEREYSPSQWSKRLSAQDIIPAHIEMVNRLSEASRKEVPSRQNLAYGSGAKMVLDVFGEDLPGASVFVYIHGGYWQELSKDLSAYVVQPLYKNGILSVVVEYELAPKATVASIVEEVRGAIVWTCNFAQTRGSRGVVLCGHSAGGHLITQVLSGKGSQNENDFAKYKDLIKGCIPISGVFDLRPLVKTYVNDPLKLTESSAWELSPFARISEFARDWQKLNLLVAVGDQDSPEFQRQSKEYHRRCLQAGMKTEYMVVNSADHFKIVEDLARGEFSLTKKIVEFIKHL